MKLPSNYVAAVVAYGEGQKHLCRSEDDPIEFCADEAEAIEKARYLVLECESRQHVVVMRIERIFEPKKSHSEYRVDGETVR